MSNFRELLQASFKSNDTEEWLDVHFTRPIGLVFALFWNRLGVHPNAITILSIFLGAAAGVMFGFTDLDHNIAGVVLLMLANFCDSTDGQMARLTGKKTLVGRVLDGFSGDVWFTFIYCAIAIRLMGQNIPGLDMHWGVWIWVLCVIAGILCHSPQSSLADYYRQIHLFFLKGKSGSELDNSLQQQTIYKSLPKSDFWGRAFYSNYAKYCRSQEKRTPAFQQFFASWQQLSPRLSDDQVRELREAFLQGSRPLMPYTNLLTFNLRAITVYVTCLLGQPWIYPVFEIVVLNALYIRMNRCHELLCRQMETRLKALAGAADPATDGDETTKEKSENNQ
jgi:hypothetical protein